VNSGNTPSAHGYCVCEQGFRPSMSVGSNPGFSAGSGVYCNDCPPGTYKVITDQTCLNCEAGKYTAATAALGWAICQACPVNSVSAIASDEITDCVCNVGWTGTGGDSLCTACIAGKYKSSIGSAPCTKCIAGKYSMAVAAVSDVCQTCVSNSVSAEAGSSCLCNAGWGGLNGGGPCVQCADGKHKPEIGNNACVMIPCPAGQSYAYASVTCTGCSCNEKQVNDLNYPNNNNRWPWQNCVWWVTGNIPIIQERWGALRQESNADAIWMCNRNLVPTLACALPLNQATWPFVRSGTYSMNWRKSSTCAVCPVATYRSQDDVNTKIMCTPCAVNSGTDSTASTHKDDCKCNAGWSKLSQPNAVCSRCPSGKYKSARSHDACTLCPMGKFMSGNLSCIPRTVKYTYTKVV